MAGILTVQTIQGPTSGVDANKVIIPSGHTLDISAGGLIPENGQILQTKVWEISPVSISTAGSWAVTTTPTMPNTYTVEDYTLTKKLSTSNVICIASGHVDHSNVGGGSPTIVALFETGAGTLIGSGYRHLRYNNDEPYVYAFSGTDTTTGLSKTYRLKCHCSGGPMHFSRQNSGSHGHSAYTVVFLEVAV